jgi:hypothetical protein
MSETFTIEFFKLAPDGAVGEVLETKIMSFCEEGGFIDWAQEALSARRCKNHLQEWPEAVRACGLNGEERYRLTI